MSKPRGQGQGSRPEGKTGLPLSIPERVFSHGVVSFLDASSIVSCARANSACAQLFSATNEALWKRLYQAHFGGKETKEQSVTWRQEYVERFCASRLSINKTYSVRTEEGGQAPSIGLRAVCIGAGSTGLVHRFSIDPSDPPSTITGGADYCDRVMEVRSLRLEAQLYDTAGLEPSIQGGSRPLLGAAIVFLAYSTYCRDSFEQIEHWLRVVTSVPSHYGSYHYHPHPETVYVLLGNEAVAAISTFFSESDPETAADPEQKAEVTPEEAKQLMERLGMDLSFQVNSDTGANCEEALQAAVKLYVSRLPPNPFDVPRAAPADRSPQQPSRPSNRPGCVVS